MKKAVHPKCHLDMTWEGKVTKGNRPVSSDCLGIPSLFSSIETPAEAENRKQIARVAGEKLLKKIFDRLKGNLGYTEAKDIFKRASTLPSKRPTSENSINMLDIYDEEARTSKDIKSLPRSLSKKLYKKDKKYGNSEEAIEKTIRRNVANHKRGISAALRVLRKSSEYVLKKRKLKARPLREK